MEKFKDIKQVEVEKDFHCDMCDSPNAIYDGKTKLGSWAYMCNQCFKIWGVGLGTGKGQILINTTKKNNE